MKYIDILDRLEDLHKQAITEKSHNYTAACIEDAIKEIKRLREYISDMKDEIAVLENRCDNW